MERHLKDQELVFMARTGLVMAEWFFRGVKFVIYRDDIGKVIGRLHRVPLALITN